MVDVVIDGLSRGNNLGGIIRGLNILRFVPLRKGLVERSGGVELWLRSCLGDILTLIGTIYLFDEEKSVDNLTCSPSLVLTETVRG